MKKVEHKFTYVSPHIYTDHKHCISFKLWWRGEQYGQFMLFSEAEFECPYFCIRQLLKEKHDLIENMNYVEEYNASI